MNGGARERPPRLDPSVLPLPSRLLATCFGAGLAPFAPGTFGTAAALLPLAPLYAAPPALWPIVLALGAILATIASVRLSRRLPAKGEGGDPGWFVLDEAAGMWVAALAASPLEARRIVIAFVLFRVFDAWKPPPLRRLERVGAGFGIVLDDLGAGVYALALGTLFHRLIPLL